MNEQCKQVEDHLADAIDGTLSETLTAHVDGCDDCRDKIHDANFVIDELRALGGDQAPPADLEAKILAAIDARMPKPVVLERSWNRRRVGVGLALAAGLAIGVVALRGHRVVEPAAAAAPWRGKVHRVMGSADGLTIEERGATRIARAGETVGAGAKLRTDSRTRARITLDDGTFMILDRGAEIALDGSASRAARLNYGSVIVDATSNDAVARIASGASSIETPGAKLAIATLGSGSSLAIARGRATADGATMTAGEGAILGEGTPTIKSGGLASAFGWSEEQEAGAEANVPGLGVLRARMPGANGDGDFALRLAQQKVSVKIAGDVARTEIEETFQSDDNRVLEGIFRFPLPPDAAIERLALDVDGKMEEGSFVDKEKGSAIWKGVLFQASPKTHQPQEEMIWVPGPWHDPALLEWRAGGRMELKIFPIPAKGSRRIVLAYTQQLGKSGGAKRYVYPLPSFGATTSTIEDFALDVQVAGHTGPLHARGYEMSGTSLHKKSFAPSGDFVLELVPSNKNAAATTYAYRSNPSEQAFVSLSLSPKIPRAADTATRTHTIVVDASRSMVGERWARASALASRVIAEMDPHDRFAVLACDVSCVPFSVAAEAPSKAKSDAVKAFLAGIMPEGASDPIAALSTAAKIAKSDAARSPRVVYIGDGAATIGARTPMAIERGARAALGDATLTAVAIGVDADMASLSAMGGAVVPYVAGQPLGAAALEVLEASYGVALRDPSIELPAGLEAVAPAKLGAIRAGSDVTIAARMTGDEIKGDAKLSGTLAGKPWSTTIPIAIRASSEPGNAFVPRVWASATVSDLERHGGDRAKIVELSKTFSVPSRYTSLLVLESPAMAAAFGVEPRKKTYEWTGDALPSAAVTETAHANAQDLSSADKAGGGGFAAPAATMAPSKAAEEMPPPMAKPVTGTKGKSAMPQGPGMWMRRQWYRTATFTTAPEMDLETRIAAARTAVVTTPDSRDKLEVLFGLVARRDSLEEAKTVMTTWIARDPLDVPATLRRSELALREGDRAHALRVLTGALDGKPDDVGLADGIADVALRDGDTKLACSLYAVHAEARPNDVDAVAKRVACLRDLGDEIGASAVLDGVDATKRPAIEARVPIIRAQKPAAVWGDLTARATFSGADVDLVLVDPKGVRVSWLSPIGARASDVHSTTNETLAIPWAGGGSWTVEVVRAGSDAPTSGTVTLQVLGETRAFPFALQGTRAVVARVNIGWASRMVPAAWE
jgi:hypothetical protein